MRKVGTIALLFLLVLSVNGCKKEIPVVLPVIPIRVIAIASLVMTDYAGSVSSGTVGAESARSLIISELTSILTSAESKLKTVWKVRSVSKFVTAQNYQELGLLRNQNSFTPIVAGREMPIFSQATKEIKRGFIKPEIAKKLCSVLKVDAVIIMFSEWRAKTGTIVPVTKAFTNNVITIWDRAGNLVFREQVDKIGQRTLGAFGIKAVNKNIITEWSRATTHSFNKIIDSILLQKL